MNYPNRCYCDIILNSISEGVFTVDLELRITSINRAAETIMDIKADNVLGDHLEKHLEPHKCPIARIIKRSLADGREVVGIHVKLAKENRREIPISLSTVFLRDDNEVIVGMVATFRDLSLIENIRREITEKYTFRDIISCNHNMHKIFNILPDIANSDSSVLIEGPSGSGKELFARAIHDLSSRRDHRLVVINCGALPDTLLESELFGYEKGAFTDARTDKPGRFALADKGTVFLDEIGDISPSLQVKLLRVLQEKEYEPLGSTRTVKADVRIVAATNKTLAEEVAKGHFREDLYFRLNVVKLNLPPLAQRREDIPLLVEHFITHFNALRGKEIQRISDRAMDLLMKYDFPGNVRELQNLIERAFILCHGSEIDVQHLPADLWGEETKTVVEKVLSDPSELKDLEKTAIRTALEQNNGHRGKTAQQLGIDKSTLWRKMRRYQMI